MAAGAPRKICIDFPRFFLIALRYLFPSIANCSNCGALELEHLLRRQRQHPLLEAPQAAAATTFAAL